MKKRIFTILTCGLLVWSGVSAQTQQQSVKAFSHLGVGLEIFSLTGFGLEVATPLNSHFALRGGISMFPYKYSDTFNVGINQGLQDDIYNAITSNQAIYDALTKAGLPTTQAEIYNLGDVDASAKLGMINGKLLADYYPWKNLSFHLTGGFYIGSNKLVNVSGAMTNAFRVLDILNDHGVDLTSELADNNEYGLTLNDVRSVNAYFKINAVKPYFGIGFGRAVPKHRVGVGFDLGALYWGTPALKSDNPRVQKMMDDNIGDLADYFKYFSVWPMMSLKINIRIF